MCHFYSLQYPGWKFSSVAQSCLTLWDPVDPVAHQASLSITNSGAHSDSGPLSRWCHPTISLSVVPFSCLQSFSASGPFPMSQFFVSGSQSIGALASASVLPTNTQDWSPLGLTSLISLQSEGLSKSSPTPQFKSIKSSALSFPYGPTITSIHDHWKNHSFD